MNGKVCPRRVAHGARGFSTIKLLVWAGLFAAAGTWAAAVIPPWYTYWKVQDLFDGVARNLSEASADEIERKLPELMNVKYIDRAQLPDEFWDNLEIEADGERVRIGSSYTVVVWPLGPIEGADPDDFDPDELRGLDRLRAWARLEFHFEPHAETP